MALKDLVESLNLHGVPGDPVRIAAVLLGIARLHNWVTGDPSGAATWLEQMAMEVLRASHRGPTSLGINACPVLTEVQERLRLNDLEADPRKVGAAVLALASERGWGAAPREMVEWLQELAIDVVNA